MRTGRYFIPRGLSLLAVIALVAPWVLADPPEAPAVSSFAPAADLAAQVQVFRDDIAESIEDDDDFELLKRRLERDGTTLLVIAQHLALHDEEHPLRPAAAALYSAGEQLAAAENVDQATAALAALDKALAGEATGEREFDWGPIASMGRLMKQVTYLNSRLRRNVRRLERNQEKIALEAAVLAAIGQAVLSDTHEVGDDQPIDEWYRFCEEMRDSAGALNAAAKANDEEAAKAAIDALDKSCNGCHEVFRVEL